ncbi:hypothetical protein ACFQZ4_43505 [Catellatospora coxensis]
MANHDPHETAQQPAPARGGRHARPRAAVRSWLQPVLIGLTLVAAFITCYVGLARDPQPHRIPVAVVGGLAAEVETALGESIEVHRVADTGAARAALTGNDVVATLDGSGTALTLHTAGANGRSTTSAVHRLVDAYAAGAGRDLTVIDQVPLARYDTNGLAGFYVAFGVSLAGFVLAQNALGLSRQLGLWQRFALLGGFSAAAGTVAAVLAGPVLDAVPAPWRRWPSR